jgi:hypothetical protein
VLGFTVTTGDTMTSQAFIPILLPFAWSGHGCPAPGQKIEQSVLSVGASQGAATWLNT